MSKLLLAGALALAMTTGIAVAQTTSSSSETTTTVTPPNVPAIVAPPAGTLSVTSTSKGTAPDGTRTDKTQTTYRDSNGVVNDSTTKTTTAPPPPAATTSTWSKSTTTTTD